MENNVKEYVLGFALSMDKSEVLLLRKNRPDFQAGKLNGIGGKIEKFDNLVVSAMTREFEEETGIKTTNKDWISYGVMESELFKVHLFWSVLDNLHTYRSITDEIVQIFKISDLMENQFKECMPNLGWLITILTDPNIKNLYIKSKYE